MAYLVLVEGRWRLATPLLPDRDPTRLWCVGSGGEAHPVSLLSTCGDRPKAFVFEVTVTERPETRWMWALVDLAGPSAERVLHQPQALDDRMGAAGSTSTDRIVDRQNGRVAGRMSRPIDAMPLLARAAAAIPSDHFAGIEVVYVNHLISDSLMVARALAGCGARLWTVSLPYGRVDGPVREAWWRGWRTSGLYRCPM